MKTQDEPTVGHLGSAKNVQDPSTGRTRTSYRKHSTTLQYTLDPPTGLAEGGGLAASIYIYFCHFANGGSHVVLYKALNPL